MIIQSFSSFIDSPKYVKLQSVSEREVSHKKFEHFSKDFMHEMNLGLNVPSVILTCVENKRSRANPWEKSGDYSTEDVKCFYFGIYGKSFSPRDLRKTFPLFICTFNRKVGVGNFQSTSESRRVKK